jgi:AGZA family xanthine/uracil permease-like MFS transporter
MPFRWSVAATGPALVVVGYLMFTQIRGVDPSDIEDGPPALLTIDLTPLTYDITVGIGAGFVSWVLIRVLKRKWSEIHWLMWVPAIAFVVYFANAWILTIVH